MDLRKKKRNENGPHMFKTERKNKWFQQDFKNKEKMVPIC